MCMTNVFLDVRSLVQPVRSFVADNQTEEAEENVKGIDLNFFGLSTRNRIKE